MADSSYQADLSDAFLSAYDEHAESIFRFILLKVSDREKAHDLVQETFTRTWDYCAKGGEITQWKAFLYRTARNLIIDTYRAKPSVSLDAMAEDQQFTPADEAMPGSDALAEINLVRAAIAELPETYRECVLLRYCEDLSPREIAEVMDLSENVVSVRIHRGVKLLRERFGS
ncbi:MAG TPA: sigma-70 family RNA polymerase sigma factor [Candidatus Paceibacterota bacterium]|nr:sigma-70 family RNA polymerase sigma factor [Candidatus Paceibacterota bacterium]